MSYRPWGQLAVARHYADIRYHEGPNNYNDFSKWQYGQYYNPWCASFVCFCAVEGGGFDFPDYYTYGAKGDSNVYWLGQHGARQGIFRSPSVSPRPGWIVLLSFTIPWQHTEMVQANGVGVLATIGGNTGDMVAYRTRAKSNVVGYLALDEAGQNPPPPKPPEDLDVKPTDVVHSCVHPKGGRYVLFANGRVLAKDGAPHHGDLTTERPQPVLDMNRNRAVSILIDRDGTGYWIEQLDGSVHTYGPAAFHGVFHKDVVVTNPGLLAAAGGLVLAGDPDIGYKSIRTDGALMTPR